MFLNPLGTTPRSDPGLVKRVKAWSIEALQREEDVSLMVTELRCSEPGCPPIETVIALLRASEPAWQYKIPKPLAQITRQDIVELFS